jgi:Fur family ferric uptake transcriptional regulator
MSAKKEATSSLEQIRGRVRAAGLRCTAARLTVLERLDEARKPMSHAELAGALASRGFDRATIYRNLIELSEVGLISRSELGDHVWRFEVRRSEHADEPAHPHFVCVDCGEVSCLPTDSVKVRSAPGKKSSDIGEITEILVRGRCGQCS